MASVLVVAGRAFLNLVVLALTTMRCWCLAPRKTQPINTIRRLFVADHSPEPKCGPLNGPAD